MREPNHPYQLLIFFLLILVLIAVIQIGVFSFALDKLGLSPFSTFLLLFSSLVGSTVNLPLFTIQSTAQHMTDIQTVRQGLFPRHPIPFTGKTIIAINVGGALIPILFSIYLMQFHGLELNNVLLALLIVSSMSYLFSRPVAGIGIGIPIFIAPFTAAIAALWIAPEQSAPLAYVCGTLGVLIGADLLRLNSVRALGTPVAAIGGAGTFDGIFITGIVAVLLA